MQCTFPNSPADIRSTTETAVKHHINSFQVYPTVCCFCFFFLFSGSVQSAAVLEASYFKPERTETNLSDITLLPHGVNPNDPCQTGREKTNSVNFLMSATDKDKGRPSRLHAILLPPLDPILFGWEQWEINFSNLGSRVGAVGVTWSVCAQSTDRLK